MPAKKEYTELLGQTFQMLTITGIADRRSSGEQLFYCSCSCGTTNHKLSKHQLISVGIKSCGCLKKDVENIDGKIFGRLTVIKRLKKLGYKKQPLFLCQCSCGNTVEVIKSKLAHKQTKSCGCLLKEIRTKYSDLVGKRYNNLLVIDKLGTISNTRDIFWKCQCSCGNITQVTTGNLINGTTKGCGCGQVELIRNYRISKGKDPNVPIKTERELLRGTLKKLKLDKQVFERDKYTCQICNEVGGKLNAHHIITVGEDDTKALDMKNMITLCKKCHFEKAHMSNYHKTDLKIQEQLTIKNSSF